MKNAYIVCARAKVRGIGCPNYECCFGPELIVAYNKLEAEYIYDTRLLEREDIWDVVDNILLLETYSREL